MSWEDSLNDEERSQWEKYVQHTREETVRKVAGSAAFISLVPGEGELDVSFATQLGMAIMLNKPILALSVAGRAVPPGLRAVATEVIEVDGDMDTEAGRQEMADKLEPAIRRITGD